MQERFAFHVVERCHHKIGAGLAQELGVVGSGDSQGRHPPGLGRGDAGDGVLDDETPLRRDSELAGGGEEDLRVRLALLEGPARDIDIDDVEESLTWSA